MSKRSRIATRTGDDGKTSLLFGQRVFKSHPQIEACGALDELSAALAMAKATCRTELHAGRFEKIQRDLIAFMGEVSTAPADMERFQESRFSRIGEDQVERLDREVEGLEAAQTGRTTDWALPGRNVHEASLEMARVVARRAERRLIGLKEGGFSVRPVLMRYMNRLSDLLWLLARQAEESGPDQPERTA